MSSPLKANARLKTRRRPGDPWISKNRVLNGGTGKAKRNCPVYRNPNFDTDETKLLIQLWGDPKVQRELITTHKKHVVISQLAAQMEEYGFYRSPEEITTRIKNMKCFYNRLKRELDTCKGLDPSWCHYAEMDAIMTRPIFSVRPNEVPAPSLKYLLEQEQEKRKERRRIAVEEGNAMSDSDEDISDILALPNTSAANVTASDSNSQLSEEPEDCMEPEAEIELEVDEKTLAALENVTADSEKSSKEDNKQIQRQPSLSDAELAIKMEVESEEFQEPEENEAKDKESKSLSSNTRQESYKTISISLDEDLLIPKVEPIDVDEPYVKIQTQQSPAPTQTTKTSTHLAEILKQPTKSPTQAVIKFSMANSSMATAISSVNTSMPTQSKISVVSPTILMPQHMSTKSSTDSTMSSLRQVRFGGNIHALLAASGSRATVTNANGMKFLLVNAADQRGPPVTTSTVSSTLATNMNAATNQPGGIQILQKPAQFQQFQQQNQQQNQQQQQQHQQQKPQQQQQQQQHQQQKQQIPLLRLKDPLKRQEYKELLKKRELSGIKSTLLKLLKVQEDANEIQNQRLAIERERLQFERTMAEKFLNIFEQRPTPTASKVFTTNSTQNVTPSGQMMLPPKLLITTMVPTSAASQSVAGPSSLSLTPNLLTSTGFTNRPAKQNNDIQLLIPKEEPPN